MWCTFGEKSPQPHLHHKKVFPTPGLGPGLKDPEKCHGIQFSAGQGYNGCWERDRHVLTHVRRLAMWSVSCAMRSTSDRPLRNTEWKDMSPIECDNLMNLQTFSPTYPFKIWENWDPRMRVWSEMSVWSQPMRFQAETVEVGAREEDCEDERPAKARTRKSVGPCVKCKEASLSGPFYTNIIYRKKDVWGEIFFKSMATPVLSNKCPLALKKRKKRKKKPVWWDLQFGANL